MFIYSQNCSRWEANDYNFESYFFGFCFGKKCNFTFEEQIGHLTNILFNPLTEVRQKWMTIIKYWLKAYLVPVF